MNTENLLLATEILNDINKNSNENQKGGFVFSLIASVTEVFIVACEYIGKGLYGLTPWLVNGHIWTNSSVLKTDAEGNPIKGPNGETLYKKKFNPGTPDGEGNLWKYLWFCIKTSLYLVIFAIGGFWVTLFGLVYLYTKIASSFNKRKDEVNNL